MLTESDDDIIPRLQHEKNVWRGIAIGLAATMVLLLVLGVGLTFVAFRQARVQAMLADEARALHEAARAEEAARQAAERQKAKQP